MHSVCGRSNERIGRFVTGAAAPMMSDRASGRGMTPALVPDPRWGELRQLFVDSVSSEHSRRAYGFALDQFFAWYAAEPRAPFSKAVVQEYRAQLEARSLSASTTSAPASHPLVTIRRKRADFSSTQQSRNREEQFTRCLFTDG